MTPEQYRAWQLRSKKLKRGKPLKRGRSLGSRKISEAEREARERFNVTVTGWGCWVARHREGHECHGPLDAHHLVKAEWIRQHFSDLPEHLLLEILYAPVIGCPVCRQGHDEIEWRSVVIYQDELTRECIEFCKRQGRGMYGRLLMACPERPVGQRSEMESELLMKGCPECGGTVVNEVCGDCRAVFT